MTGDFLGTITCDSLLIICQECSLKQHCRPHVPDTYIAFYAGTFFLLTFVKTGIKFVQ